MSHIGNDAWYEQQQDTFLEDYGSLINVLQEYHQVMANQSDSQRMRYHLKLSG